MENFMKIRDVSAKYDITARTLRYYEDMGLISSVRNDGYAYRLYDETAMKRLEQILILRKLNISIRDIQSIFSASGSGVVLDVLSKKVQNIDDEVALLHELKDIVLEFIRQIEQIDFGRDSDIKMIYDQAKEIETRLVNVDYIGKPSNVNRLLEVTEKLEKKPDVRLVALPACRMVTSGVEQGDNHQRFDKMWGRLDAKRKDRFYPRDFMYHDQEKGGSVWLYAIEEWVSEKDTEGFEIIDFEGGLYATSIVHDFDVNEVIKAYNGIKEWLAQNSSFVLDERPGHAVMFQVAVPETYELLGYRQVEYFFPVKIREG
ncbi:Nodulation protein NolA [compost metagenome]